MLSIGPRRSVKVTKTKTTIEVKDSSYLSVQGDGTWPKVTLTPGLENGHLLLIEASMHYGFTMVDKLTPHRTLLSGTKKMASGDTMLLVWSGTRWVQMSYSKNR